MHHSDLSIIINEVNIREYIKDIEPMLRDLHLSEQELFNKTDDWENISKNYLQHIIQMQEEYEGTCLLAFHQNEVIGFIFGYTEDQDDSRIEKYTGKQLYISDGYVKRPYRKKGVYRLLNNKIEANYVAKGIRRIIRFTLSSNTRMMKFLEFEGYKATRILYEKWLDDDGCKTIELRLNKPED
jgi:GNAT superfamily N-acetyltransferase